MKKSRFADMCLLARNGYISVRKEDEENIPDQKKIKAIIECPSRIQSWIEMPSPRFHVSMAQDDLIELAVILLIVSLGGVKSDVWIELSKGSHGFNAVKISKTIDYLLINEFNLKNLKEISIDDLQDLAGVDSFWDLPYFGFLLQDSLRSRDEDAPEWVQGALIVGSGRSRSIFSIALNILYFSLNTHENSAIEFNHFFGLLHGSVEVSFLIS